jgi:hypothetical protein
LTELPRLEPKNMEIDNNFPTISRKHEKCVLECNNMKEIL